MAPPHSDATSAKRDARSRAPPNPRLDPAAAVGSDLFVAAHDGDLRLLKRLVTALDAGRGRPREALEAAVKSQDSGPLHCAAKKGRLPVCRYLVEELGMDVDAVDDKDVTPLVWAMLGGSMDVVSYLLDHGANPAKVDHQGFAPLHHAAGRGDREMVEILLAKGVYVDLVSISGAPLHVAAFGGHDEAVKALLENNADYNKRVPGADTPLLAAIAASSVKCVKLLVEAGANVNHGLITPLAAAAANKGLTACLKCLLEAGADPNVPNPTAIAEERFVNQTTWNHVPGSIRAVRLQSEHGMLEGSGLKCKWTNTSGRMPIEIAALNGTREDVEILFPATSCIPTVHDWSIDGIMHHAKSVSRKQVENSNVRRLVEFKSHAVNSIKRNDYYSAATVYTLAIEYDRHDATLFSNRSLCWLRMGDGHKAFLDALACREMRPTWPKACYRQGAALMLLKDYKGACDAFLDAAKLDPWSAEIEAALREALNTLKIFRGATKAI